MAGQFQYIRGTGVAPRQKSMDDASPSRSRFSAPGKYHVFNGASQTFYEKDGILIF